jgi:phosphoglycolate phosphatase
MTKRLAIFDIDGTLHKTEVMSRVAYSIVMPELGLPVPKRELLISTYGCNTEEIIRRLGIPEDRQAAFLKRIDQEEIAQLKRVGECYEGIAERLLRLHGAGIEISVCSLCSPAYMEAFLNHFALGDLISCKRNEASGGEKTQLLQQILDERKPDKAVMVGDRAFDIDAAKSNGIASIGCLYGYAPEELNDADVAVSNVPELYNAIQRLLQE